MDARERLRESLLVLRHQTGDQSALEELIELHHAPLGYFLRRLLGNAADADDTLQDVWLKVIRNLGRLDKPEAFAVWLYRIARNAAYRRLGRRSDVPLPEPEVVPAEEPGDEAEFSAEEAARIHECLRRLTTEHREVLVLRFMEDMSYEEIAGVVGCTLGTVRSRIHYAKHALRKQMEAGDEREERAS